MELARLIYPINNKFRVTQTMMWSKDQKFARERETHKPSNSALLLVPVPQFRNQFVVLDWCALSCNVPTLGHHHRAEIYDDQNSQMGARASTWVFERHCGVHIALMIIFHHYEPFRTGWLWFRCILTISMILTILSYKSMEFTEEVILGTLLGGTSQCNSSLESGGETLQDGMARSDFQWLGKPQGEIRSFSKVKRLIN
jgi:hypothetical protein